MRTIPLYLMALIVAIANSPTDVWQICAWNHGTERVEPWRAKLTSSVTTVCTKTWLAVLRAWNSEKGGVPATLLTAGALALLCLTVDVHASMAIVGTSSLKVLRQRLTDFHNELRSINDKVVGENRSMTAEERTKVNDLKARVADTKEQLQLAEELNEQERNAPAVDDPDDAAARAATTRKTGFQSFGERLQAVRRASLPGQAPDPRLTQYAIAPGMNESNPSDGGWLVDQERVVDVRQRMYTTGQLLSRVFQLPVGPNSNGVKLMAIDETSRADGSRFGGITSYWLDEGGTKTASKPRFRPMELNLKKIAALVRVTDELLQDAVALEAWIMRFLPLELQFRVEDSILSGTGAGMPLGILNSGAAVVVNRQVAGAVVFEDIINMWSRFWAPSRSAAGAAWFIDQSVETNLFAMSLQVGAGGVPVYLPANGLTGRPFSTLFGLPVIPAEYLSALGTKGDVILADLSNYTLIDKGGVQTASSIHVYFVTDETAFRFVYRVDGQPEWNAPLTPKNGGPTLSPFVVLN